MMISLFYINLSPRRFNVAIIFILCAILILQSCVCGSTVLKPKIDDNDNENRVTDAINVNDTTQHQQQEQEQQQHSRNTTPRQPTLLSIIDPITNDFVNALHNQLYEYIKNKIHLVETMTKTTATVTKATTTKFLRHVPAPNNNNGSLKILLDKSELNIGDSLTVSILLFPKKNNDNNNNDNIDTMALQDNDIVLLYCRPFETQKGQRIDDIMLEAATISQIRATHNFHQKQQEQKQKTANIDDNTTMTTWHIPSFPIIRHESCHFELHRSMYYNTTTPHAVPASLNTKQQQESTFSSYIHLASSKRIKLQMTNLPTALHLALTSSPSSMIIQFTTGANGPGGKPVAVYGTHNPPNSHKVTGTSHTYTANDMCQEPANITEAGKFQPPGWLHTIEMTGLEPNTIYYYKVGLASGQGIVWSDVSSFVSPPLVGDNSQPFSYIVYGDQGCPSKGWGSGSSWITAMMEREYHSALIQNSNKNNDNDSTNNVQNPNHHLAARAVHHFGDLSYAMGAAHIWEEWSQMVSLFASHVPLMIGVGNHEYDHTSGGDNGKDPSGVTTSNGFMPRWGNFKDDSGGECGVPTNYRFQMPQSNPYNIPSNKVFWYSYNYANVHTIMISSEHDLSISSPQYNWLLADLKSVNRTQTPWVILETHRPLYEAEAFFDQYAVSVGMRYEMEHLLRDYQVDVVLAGHYHEYHVTCDGLYQSLCHNGGPIHITVGTAGAQLDNYRYQIPNFWSRNQIQGSYGYGRITIANATALHFEFIKAGPIDDETSGNVMDEFWVYRNRNQQGSIIMQSRK